jgi:hypothetical protein
LGVLVEVPIDLPVEHLVGIVDVSDVSTVIFALLSLAHGLVPLIRAASPDWFEAVSVLDQR